MFEKILAILQAGSKFLYRGRGNCLQFSSNPQYNCHGASLEGSKWTAFQSLSASQSMPIFLSLSDLLSSIHITSHHITSHHITSIHITSHHITSHHITSHHVTSRHITSRILILSQNVWILSSFKLVHLSYFSSPSPRCPDRLWDPPSLLSNGYRRLFPRG
jgi:hypothetical protein